MIVYILPTFNAVRSIHLRELRDPKLQLGVPVENGPSKFWHIIDIFLSFPVFTLKYRIFGIYFRQLGLYASK